MHIILINFIQNVFMFKIEMFMNCKTLLNYKLQLTRHKMGLRISIVIILHTLHILGTTTTYIVVSLCLIIKLMSSTRVLKTNELNNNKYQDNCTVYTCIVYTLYRLYNKHRFQKKDCQKNNNNK
jgi:hypothetical protein